MDWSSVIGVTLSLYGALLSSVLGIIQLQTYRAKRQHIRVEAERYIDLSSETVQFRLSNRSDQATEIHELMLSQFGKGKKVEFHSLIGVEVKASKVDRFRPQEDKELASPFRLEPGESVWVCVDTEMVNAFFKDFPETKFSENEVRSNLFELEITHSRSDIPLLTLFEMDARYVDPQYNIVPWETLVPIWKRHSFRPQYRKYS